MDSAREGTAAFEAILKMLGITLEETKEKTVDAFDIKDDIRAAELDIQMTLAQSAQERLVIQNEAAKKEF